MMLKRRRWLQGIGAAALLAGAPAALRAQGGAPRDDVELLSAQLIKPATEQAIQRGLAYLASKQNEDGSFAGSGYARNVAVVSLGGLAFLSSGDTPGRGAYGGVLNRSVSFVLRCADETGFISLASAASHGPMYDHGFATLFLAEVYGMSSDSEVREKLSRAVRLIVQTQNQEGGWRYQPKPDEADISVTICQMMALRAARNAGLYVPNATVDRCVDYVKRCQNPDGGFMYTAMGGPSRFARSAAGLVALYSAGLYEGDEIKRGLDYLHQHTPKLDDFGADTHALYGHYYAAQALWQAGGERWKKWYPAIHDVLLKLQQKDGAWPDLISNEYGTAMACIILQMPNNYLPIFQR